MSTELDGSMRAIRSIKAARAEGSHAKAVLDDAEKARRHGITAVWTEVVGYEVGFSGMLAVTVFMLAFGSWRVQQGYLTVAALVAFIMYVQGFMMPLMQLADGFSTIQNGLAASKRIAEAQDIPYEEPATVILSNDEGFDEATAYEQPSVTLPQTVTPDQEHEVPAVEFRNVTARYKLSDPEVLQNVSLTIPRRGHVAIVGPSGAGKSSIVSLALRFLSPSQGEVLLDGVPYDQFTYAQVRARFAFVEQDPPVLPGTVHDNLEPANFEASAAGLQAVLEEVGLDADIAALPQGMDTELGANTLTGGGRQRLAIARALLAGAEVLILDDATSQLSGSAHESISRALRAAAARGAVVTIGNRLSTVSGAEKVIVLEKGRVRAMGTHEYLQGKDPLYRSLVTAD
jgi:ATP-binding cassette subfamily B protein